jgi:Ca2+-binding RTX toxin-like protein
MSLNPNALPSVNFDLSDWKLQLPIDVQGYFAGTAAEVKTLTNYVHKDYFYTGSDGAMVLAAPVDGATTGGSIYARSELREMNGTAIAEWSLQQGGHLSATLQVDVAPRHVDGTYGKVVVGQVHGGDGQLVRLAWEDGTLFFANDITSNGTKDVRIELLNAQGQQPSVSLNETFTYHIDVSADRLVVSVVADGQVYSSSSSINDAWNDNSFYFKAGAYLGVNENNGSGSGQVSIFAVDATHSGIAEPTPVSSTAIVMPAPAPIVQPTSEYAWETTRTFNGTQGADNLRGSYTNDMLVGGAGNDRLNGAYGHDVLFGGSGNDTFVFDRNASTSGNSDQIIDFSSGQDNFELSSGKFSSLASGFTAANLFFGEKAHDSNDFIIYNQATGDLFYDRDGSGSRSAQLIANLQNKATVRIEDFDIV